MIDFSALAAVGVNPASHCATVRRPTKISRRVCIAGEHIIIYNVNQKKSVLTAAVRVKVYHEA